MDESDEYVKMCNYPEIQNAREFNEDEDFVYHGFLFGDEKRVWLPRQDQIQDMLSIQNEFTLGVACNCQKEWSLIGKMKILMEAKWQYFSKLKSMEQLWLACMMFELRNKKWNGEAWE